jgi:hypothetical protein
MLLKGKTTAPALRNCWIVAFFVMLKPSLCEDENANVIDTRQ